MIRGLLNNHDCVSIRYERLRHTPISYVCKVYAYILVGGIHSVYISRLSRQLYS